MGEDYGMLDGDERAAFVEAISGLDGVNPEHLKDVLSLGIISFYPQCLLYRAFFLHDGAVSEMDFVRHADELVYLDGSPDPILDLNEQRALKLTENNVSAYLRFYLNHVRGQHGYFHVVESEQDIHWGAESESVDGEVASVREKVRHLVKPLKIVDRREGWYVFEAFILFKDALVVSTIEVDISGSLKFSDERVLVDGLPLYAKRNKSMKKEKSRMVGMKGNWTRVSAKTLPGLATAFPSAICNRVDEDNAVEIVSMPLRSLPGCKLVRVDFKDQEVNSGHYALWRRDVLHPLSGASNVIHDVRNWNEFQLNDENVIEYLIFFCQFLDSDKGSFIIIESSDDIKQIASPQTGDKSKNENEGLWKYIELNQERLDELIKPPVVTHDTKDIAWKVEAFVHYGGELFKSLFKVSREGTVEMLDDDLVAGNKREVEIAIHREFIKEQLLRSIRSGSASPLYAPDKELTDDDLVADFSKFVLGFYPCIAVESDHVNCEVTVTRILREYSSEKPKVKAAEDRSGDAVAHVPDIKDGEILLLSMHKHNSILKEEWVIHHLGVTDAVTIIGCPTVDALPSSLRRLVDITITLHTPDSDFVKSLFHKLTGYTWPESVDIDQEIWPRYLMPADLRQLLRLQHISVVDDRPRDQDKGQWSSRLLAMQLYKRITDRLQTVIDPNVPDLVNLHGLGEAKTIAQDLITDIKAALSGKIKWSEIDRGMLIAGGPGTGKTLLAKVIAKECGIHFVPVSGANWIIGTDGLGEHIKAIRTTFAEARQMSPCILFIDEIDSIGNRESFRDHNRQYNVEIVNTLLQEIQGINSGRPVFVIAATNHAHNIDPALRRAGRLEQVVHVPLPDRKALAEIFKQYLREYIEQDTVEGKLDYSMLAAIAVGSTGADVERFVRNAARRARKEGCQIKARHLVAAITGRSRVDARLERLCQDEVQRTAVHEAGHAIAVMLCKECPTELTMVSAVPRDDGSLGVTKTALREDQVLTKTAYLEHLEILLAGRAAEEMWYGKNNISSGSGGSSIHSDLAKATHVAADIVCKHGMGASGHLRWVSDIDDHGRLNEVRTLIDDAYDRILNKLGVHRPLLEKLQEKLLEELEITAVDLDQLAEQYNTTAV